MKLHSGAVVEDARRSRALARRAARHRRARTFGAGTRATRRTASPRSPIARAPTRAHRSSSLQYPDARAFVENKFLNERISIQSTHEALVARLAAALQPRLAATELRDGARVSRRRCRRRSFRSRRRGEKDFNENHRPFILRDYKTARVNDLWVSDHMQHDVFVYNDLGEAFGIAADGGLPAVPHRLHGHPLAQADGLRVERESLERIDLLGAALGHLPLRRAARALHRQRQRLQVAAPQAVLVRLGVGVRSPPSTTRRRSRTRAGTARCTRASTRSCSRRTAGPRTTAARKNAAGAARARGVPREKQKLHAADAGERVLPPGAMWIEQRYNAEHAHRGHAMDRRTPNDVFDMKLAAGAAPPHRHARDRGAVLEAREAPAARGRLRGDRQPPLRAERRGELCRAEHCCRRRARSPDRVRPARTSPRRWLRGSGRLPRDDALHGAGEWGGASGGDPREQEAAVRIHEGDRALPRSPRYKRAVAGDMSERDVLRAGRGLGVGSRVVTPEDPMFHAEQFHQTARAAWSSSLPPPRPRRRR
jgi:hypothetical protein